MDHEFLDPTFARPDAYVALSDDARAHHAKADDDLCQISLPGAPIQYFVRATLPVAVVGRPDGMMWGIWARVDAATFGRVLELWSEGDVTSEPPFQVALANDVPGMSSLGLRALMRLMGPTDRPSLDLLGGDDHPFVAECRSGIDAARADAYVSARAHVGLDS